MVVRARVIGRFDGEGRALMSIADDEAQRPGGGGMVTDLLLEPRFAAEYAPADLCTDEGSTPDRIAVSCIDGVSGKTVRIAVAREGRALRVTQDGQQTLWKPNTHPAPDCFELRGLTETRDLEPLRKTWMLDEPKCVRDPSRAPVKVTMKLDGARIEPGTPKDFQYCNATVTLLGLGEPRSLGMLSDLCGSTRVRHVTGLNGIEVEASDDTTVRRFAYQLGDRVYCAEDGRVHAADLPCGSRAVFDIVAPRQIRLLRD